VKPASHLQVVLKQRTWDKEMLLWIGSEKELLQALGPSKYVVLDLLDLFDVQNLPLDDEETREQVHERLRSYLREIPRGPDARTILIIKSIGLLARYNVGLKDFYDWFIGSFTMVILLLDGMPGQEEWPEDVRCDGNRLTGYFTEPGMVKDILSVTG